MKKHEESLMPYRPIHEMKKKVKQNENLWSKIDSESVKMDSWKKKGSSGGCGVFTGLPFSKTVSKTTAVVMVDVAAKEPKFAVALDGYIPNSDVRLHFPPIFLTDPPLKKKKIPRSEEEKFIKTILSKHLAEDKILNVKSRTSNRELKSRKKTHYVASENDVINVQNEVTDHFNFELDMVLAENSSQQPAVKVLKKRQIPTRRTSIKNLKSKISTHQISIQDMLFSKAISDSELLTENSIEEIDIDILEKLDKKIEDDEKHGISNQKIQDRIAKDRQCKMNEAELLRCIVLLVGKYGSTKTMYREITKSFNKNYEAIILLESHLETRQKRLEFLNTLTDPQHLFKFLINFYNNKSELLDIIEDILMGGDETNLKQLILFCGDHYKIKEFLAQFVATKNYAQYILSKNILSEKERRIDLEKCMRGGSISENILTNIFMGNEPDGKRFFECICECQMKEMISIIERMKEKKYAQSKLLENINKEVPSISKSSTESISVSSMAQKQTPIQIPFSIHLPALPEYNANSWKMMMSEYVAKMLTSITPEMQVNIEVPEICFEDENLLELMKELSFLHSEVLRLLKVYLNNDIKNAKKLLNGLVAEDDLAYQALIELIGEKEAMQIIKSLRLKQAKVIEKIIEFHGDKSHMLEASLLLRSMSHDLPESLAKNLMTWLNAGKVSAHDITVALNKLNLNSRSTDSSEVDSKLVGDSSDFALTMSSRKTRKSIMNFTLPESEEIEITKGPLRRGSMMHGKLEFDYRDIPERESFSDGVISLKMKHSIKESLPEIIKVEDSYNFFESPKKLTQISELFIDPEVTEVIIGRSTESNICQDICNNPWFKSEPVTQYVDVVLKLTDILTETKNSEEAVAITATLATVAEHTVDKETNQIIVDKLINQAVGLMKEDEQNEKIWINILTKMDIEKKLEMAESQPSRIDELSKINTEKGLRIKGNKMLEDAISLSYEKNMRIRKIIEILKNFGLEKAEELEKVINDKIAVCTLFVPEFREHVNTVRDLGMDFYEPHELVNISPNIIIRKNEEDVKIRIVKSNKLDEIKEWLHGQGTLEDISFWEKALNSAKTKNKKSFETNISYTISKEVTIEEKQSDDEKLEEKLDEEINEIDEKIGEAVTFLSYSDISVESIHIDKESFYSDKVELIKVPSVYQHVSSSSNMKMNDAIIITPLTLKDEVYKGKIVKESVIIEDNIPYEIGQSRLLKARALSKRKPKDPYFDFHAMYGSTAYYLPYINPLIQRQKPSRETSFPQYSSVKKQDKQVYENVNKMINGFGPSNTEVTPSFKNTHFMRRPTDVPLSDWVKLGAPRMATNMILANQEYKATNSKCRFHHLTKLKLHNYGISVAKHIQRCELVEFIGKANAAIKHENLKAKLHSTVSTLSTAESPPASFLTSF